MLLNNRTLGSRMKIFLNQGLQVVPDNCRSDVLIENDYNFMTYKGMPLACKRNPTASKVPFRSVGLSSGFFSC